MKRVVGYRELCVAAFEAWGSGFLSLPGWRLGAAQRIAGPLGRVVEAGREGAAMIEYPDDPSWVLL